MVFWKKGLEMKIGFDISQTAENKAGCGFFADQLIKMLAEIDDNNEYILYPCFYNYCHPDYKKATQLNKNNFSYKIVKGLGNVNNKSMGDIDIIHSNNFTYPENVSALKVVTIYDVGFLDYPEFTTEANRIVCYNGTFDSLLFADKILTISNYSKNRLLYYFPTIKEEKIQVIKLGAREDLHKEIIDFSILKKFNIESGAYYLSVGTIEPRKNYETLLKAFKKYVSQTKEPKKLCIAGGYGWLEEDFISKIEELELQSYVTVTGYVTEQQLSNLYRECYGFIYPTWYEGFGLPVLEAMSFKKPIISSNVTSIPEIVGEAGILIDPNSSSQLTQAITLLDKDNVLYKELCIAGYERSKGFTWEECAKQVLKIYENLYNMREEVIPWKQIV